MLRGAEVDRVLLGAEVDRALRDAGRVFLETAGAEDRLLVLDASLLRDRGAERCLVGTRRTSRLLVSAGATRWLRFSIARSLLNRVLTLLV